MKIILLLLLIISNVSYASVTYDLTGGNLNYTGPWASNSPNVEATLTIIDEVSQTLTDKQDILDFFNSSLFSVKMTTSSGLLTEMDNSNSSWEFYDDYTNVSQTLSIDSNQIRLQFDTPDYTSVRILLRGISSFLGVVQFTQMNSPSWSNQTYAHFDYRAVNQAIDSKTYNSPFTFNAVPEPSAVSLCAVGLGALAMMRRRRS